MQSPELFINCAIPAWDIPTVPVFGTNQQFPVRHIYCVGRNYAEHAKEMGGDATKEPPFFFCKSADAVFPVVAPAVGTVRYPLATRNYHHEIELVVAIGKRGMQLAAEKANDIVFGYATGLDMTRRDLQLVAREKGRPWDRFRDFVSADGRQPTSALPKRPVTDNAVLWLPGRPLVAGSACSRCSQRAAIRISGR